MTESNDMEDSENADFTNMLKVIEDCRSGMRFEEDNFLIQVMPRLLAKIRSGLKMEEPAFDVASHVRLLKRVKEMLRQNRESSPEIPSAGLLAAVEAASAVVKGGMDLKSVLEANDPFTNIAQQKWKILRLQIKVDAGEHATPTYKIEFEAESKKYGDVYSRADARLAECKKDIVESGESALAFANGQMEDLEILNWSKDSTNTTPTVRVLEMCEVSGLGKEDWQPKVVEKFTAVSHRLAFLNKVYADYAVHVDERQNSLMEKATGLVLRAKALTIEGAIYQAYMSNAAKKNYGNIKQDMSAHGVAESDVQAALLTIMNEKINPAPPTAKATAAKKTRPSDGGS